MKKVLALAAAGVFAFSVTAYAGGAGGCGGFSTLTAGTSHPVTTPLETATQTPTPTTKTGG